MVIPTGLSLKLVPLPPARERYADAAFAAIPPPPPPPAPAATAGQAPATGAAAPAPPALPAAPVANTTAGAAPGSYQACVISRESGGNPAAVNPSSGAGGLYQFLPSTWAALGYSGLPQNASVAQQTQAFNTLYAQQGSAPWVSDGC
jgi:resuscitation-promoting factor RpfC